MVAEGAGIQEIHWRAPLRRGRDCKDGPDGAGLSKSKLIRHFFPLRGLNSLEIENDPYKSLPYDLQNSGYCESLSTGHLYVDS